MASEKKDPVKPATAAPPAAPTPPATATVNGRPIGWDDQTATPAKRD